GERLLMPKGGKRERLSTRRRCGRRAIPSPAAPPFLGTSRHTSADPAGFSGIPQWHAGCLGGSPKHAPERRSSMHRTYGLLLITALVSSSFGCVAVVTGGGNSTSSSSNASPGGDQGGSISPSPGIPGTSGGDDPGALKAENIAEIDGDTVEVSLGNYV